VVIGSASGCTLMHGARDAGVVGACPPCVVFLSSGDRDPSGPSSFRQYFGVFQRISHLSHQPCLGAAGGRA
jgi:hypothetical protein